MSNQFKIVKYAGKHKIKDTKTGKSQEIDIEKYMNGGGKDKKKKLTPEEVQALRDTTGVQFTDEGANQLFEMRGQMERPETPTFNLGKYEDKEYFNVDYSDGTFTVSPTTKNPANYAKYKEYIKYLQKQNPDAKLSTGNKSGYLPFKQRLEYGGKLKKYNIGGNGILNEEVDAAETEYDINEMNAFGNSSEIMNSQPDNEAFANYLKNYSQDETDVELNEQQEDRNYNMFNPYAGVDIPTAAYTLGQGIKDKNAGNIIGSGLKLGLGIGRNLVSGMGQANRSNQVMNDYYEDQKNNRNPYVYAENGGKLQKLAYGGKKDEEIATGEYMQGVENEKINPVNAEVEKGEYFQTNEGDIAEVIGNKHSQGGEKIQMEEADRVLSDKLKLGGETARMLSKKYDMKLKAKDTYSKVLDKFRTKSKLNKILDRESELIKKIDEQKNVEDATTRDFNLQVLAEKKTELEQEKSPIEEKRKEMFDELFNIQEASKTDTPKESNSFEMGGKLESMAAEYNIPIERARELVEQFKNGGKLKKYDEGDCGPGTVWSESLGECIPEQKLSSLSGVPEGQSIDSTTGLAGSVNKRTFEDAKVRNNWYFENKPNFNPKDKSQTLDFQKAYNEKAKEVGAPLLKEDGIWGEQTNSTQLMSSPVQGIVTGDQTLIQPTLPGKQYTPPYTPYEKKGDKPKQEGDSLGAYLFPDEMPLGPTALAGTIKPERRFDRVSPTEIDVTPYLQDSRNREQAQVQSLEGLSPNVRAAVLANMRANSQTQESQVRNQIDTQNLQSQERAQYTNAQIQAREMNASAADRLAYEQRQYAAVAATDFDIDNYFNQRQAINSQRFRDISNLNLVNQTNDSVFFDGQQYRRKQGSSDRDFARNISRNKGLN